MSQSILLWNNPTVREHKFRLCILAVGEFLFPAFIWILAFFGLIPWARALWLYGAIYYVFFVFIWVVNIIMSRSESKILYLFATFANGFILALNIFVLSLEIYGLVACWTGSLPIECRTNQLWDGVVLLITGIPLLYITVSIFLIYCNMIALIRQVGPRKKREPFLPPNQTNFRVSYTEPIRKQYKRAVK